jgi:hypothetical protein
MGDIASLYTPPLPSASPTVPRPRSSADKATIHKLTFYAAHVAAAPTTQLRQIANEIARVSASASNEPEDERLSADAAGYSAVVGPPDLQVPRGAGGNPALVNDFAHIEEIK